MANPEQPSLQSKIVPEAVSCVFMMANGERGTEGRAVGASKRPKG